MKRASGTIVWEGRLARVSEGEIQLVTDDLRERSVAIAAVAHAKRVAPCGTGERGRKGR